MASPDANGLLSTADGPASNLYSAEFPTPRRMFLLAFCLWSFLAVLRYGLAMSHLDIIVEWGVIDTLMYLPAAAALFYHIFVSHTRKRYLHAKPLEAEHPDHLEPEKITHCLALLVATEKEELLMSLVRDLKALPCRGRKVLIVGAEQVTEDIKGKMERIREINSNAEDGGRAFAEVLYTRHELREKEIRGTCSNHYEVQIAAERYFRTNCSDSGFSYSNVILSKFDVNMKLDRHRLLLEEIEAIWCSVDAVHRKGISFMPNIVWSAALPDWQRTTREKIASSWMNCAMHIAPFSMAFVSGSLEGICEGGYTPPSLLAEDELTFTKKQALIPCPRSYQLFSAIMKCQASDEAANKTFFSDFLDKKMARWFLGWLEVQNYLTKWIFCRRRLNNTGSEHPRVRNAFRALGALLLNYQRKYLAFVMPVSFIPMFFVDRAAHHVNQHSPPGEPYYGRLLDFQFVIASITAFFFRFSPGPYSDQEL